MSDQLPSIPPVLESAWKRFADYDNTAENLQDQYYLLRRWVLYFSIIATFLAIILDNFRIWFPGPVITFLQVLLIMVPIIGSVIVAFLSKYQQGQKYLALRAGAEEILKEIYKYRTIMRTNANRDKWLNGRVAEIQRKVHRSLGGEVVVKPYKGEHINPRYYPGSADADEGIVDLDSDEYIRVRLESQLVWHIKKIQEHQKSRMRFTIAILMFGGIGALFAGLDMLFAGIAVWVALTTAISSAVTNWQELMGVDVIIPNYSKVILELNILRDNWISLTSKEKTQVEFFKMVRSTEKILWSQNVQFISAMQEAMEEAEAQQEKIVEEMIEMSQEVAGRVQEEILEEARRSMEEAAQAAAASGMIEDHQRLPIGMIFNAALGPAQAVILHDDEEDAPDGFGEEKPSAPAKAKAEPTPKTKPEPELEPELSDNDEVETDEEVDPIFDAINSAVTAAIEKSDAMQSSKQTQKKASPEDLVEDEATKAAQDAADEYIQDAADAFSLDDEE
ncbi:MAG TPA: hypothetical protein DEH22_15125 [Chloroflexi bacterium]|nr:hypothetical protein [Chloroflexota bacterium]